MTNINPIKFGISGQNFLNKEVNQEIAKDAAKEKEVPQKEVAAKDVLNYMAATNSDLVPASVKKTVDVNKYVNAEQMARIESFMKRFEADFDEITATALNEFPDISKEAANGIALAYINQTY